ncbi:MAG: polysaccharide biosynthesis protein [Clostridia bacterium]|nr:polysaccharide biosynthesis protein [Clostridia bacterium]
MNKFKQFIFNGILLTAVSLAMRGVGVSFNVYISNKVGAEAMGLFTLISTVYGFAITLATSGINLAATRLVSEAMGELSTAGIREVRARSAAVRVVMRKCLLYSLFFGALSSLLLYFLAPFLSLSLLKDGRCISSLRLLSLTLIPISLSSALSGYFSAVRRVYKNAATQVVEQIIKIFICVILLTYFFANDVESACLCVVAGGAIAELVSFLFQVLMYLAEKKVSSNTANSPDGRLVRRKLLGIALPVAFSAYLRSGLITVEHILIPWGLERSGASRSHSLRAYGTVHSMVFPIIFFPSAILSSFAGLLVPEISEARAAGRGDIVNRIISNVFESALIFAIGTAGIMMCFSYELGNMIYPASDAGRYIRMIAPLIPIMYLDTAVDAILKGLGEQVYSMGVNIIDSLLSVILVVILLPALGINGYIITVYFTEIINATLSITRLLSVSQFKPRIARLVFAPLMAIILSSSAVKYLSLLPVFNLLTGSVQIISHIILSAIIYLLLLTLLGSLRPNKLRRGFSLLREN